MRISAAVALGTLLVQTSAQAQAANSLSGRVLFAGRAAEGKPVDMSSEPHCRDVHQGKQLLDNALVVSGDGGIANVVVFIRSAPSKGAAVPAQPVTIDQAGCLYTPRALALQVGQKLVVRNSDPLLHNVHVSAKANPPFNIGQPIAGLQATRTFRAPELGIKVQCDIHDWMHASIAVFDHPFFAVTSADGQFRIDNLPPGEYVLEVWHETLGTRSTTVQVPAADVVVRFQ